MYTDKQLEEKWAELEDRTFYEDEDLWLRLQSDWFVFKKGAVREDIWQWFDERHSKGVYWLMENI